jgi:hypothetical protein
VQAYQTSVEFLSMWSRHTVGAPSKLKVIHSVITWSVCQCYRSFVVQCSLPCLYHSCEIQFRTSFHLWLLCEKTHTKSAEEFPETLCPTGDTISKLVKKVWTDGILIDRKSLKRNRVLIEEKLDDSSHRLQNPPRKSLRWLAQVVFLQAVHGKQLNCCIYVHIKLLLFLKLNL